MSEEIERLATELRDQAQNYGYSVGLNDGSHAKWQTDFLSADKNLRSAIAALRAERDAAQAEVARLREALQFYADREHLSGDDWSKWDWADPEAANWLCPDSDESLMVEDGWMARAALESKT